VKRDGIASCRREIAAIKAEILAGNPDLVGLCLSLSDWSGELKLLLEESGEEKSRRSKTPAADGNKKEGDQALSE
jgi:hypothetical protein